MPWQPAWQILIHRHISVFHNISKITVCDNNTEKKKRTSFPSQKHLPLSKDTEGAIQDTKNHKAEMQSREAKMSSNHSFKSYTSA